MANVTAMTLIVYFLGLLALWLMCLFRPSLCTDRIKYIGAGAAFLGVFLMLLQMCARSKPKSGGFLMISLLGLLVAQTVLWAACLTRCSSSAADTVKWSGIGTAVLAVAVGAVAVLQSGQK